MAKKDKNWDIVKGQKKSETMRFRDVYEDQQLERSSIAPKQTMTSRNILAASVAIFGFFLVWLVVTLVQMLKFTPTKEISQDPAGLYYHVTEGFYYNKEDWSKRLTYEEYAALEADYDPNWPEVEKPGDRPKQAVVEKYNRSANGYKEAYKVILPTGEEVFGRTADERFTQDDANAFCEEYNTNLKDILDAYDKQVADYDEYIRRTNNPADTYAKVGEHYEGLYDGSFISVSDYNKKVEEYEQAKAKGGEEFEVPIQPINPKNIYVGENEGSRGENPYSNPETVYEALKSDGTVSTSKTDYVTKYRVKNPDPYPSEIYTPMYGEDGETIAGYYKPNPYDGFWNDYEAVTEEGSEIPVGFKRISDGTEITIDEYNDLVNSYNSWDLAQISVEEYEKLVDDWNSYKGDEISADRYTELITLYHSWTEKGFLQYRNKLDATTISWQEYGELENKYAQDNALYQDQFKAHREEYHDGKLIDEKTFDMSFNLSKFFISLLGFMVVYGLLHMVLSRNLAAQNALSDTSDINQYHNDQHIALPQEIMRDYDYFPDVGAHSEVSASGILAHIAIDPKGLKNVDVVQRYDKDITDKNDKELILHYKFEPIEDENGKPVTKSLPIIDKDFMNALYEASLGEMGQGDEDVREFYDMTKVPYNPGNNNRDKLSGKKKGPDGNPLKNKDGSTVSLYDTVADLINYEWEFPIYEPQRPAGAYIVDTAPVNTMVYMALCV